ncbi:hypothetical protein [Paenibacillus beijingensis]|uniref:HTH LytTR-type domain-containing protein n=1 Tax=Paenibacillus beijingensis TaxID=1126833 RepID=A0A0D5NFJ4_9BACL|nr:hypothetical protein [Paenibacillus beijingensis]AJY73673.1 hypothetical protein VN24_02295 [Paenibacillus beijingensis]
MDQSYLSVSVDIKGTSLTLIPYETILYLEYLRASGCVLVHTGIKDGYLPGTLKFWGNAISGSGFITLIEADRNIFINPEKVELLDNKLNKAYFELNPSRHSKNCTMSVERFKQVVKAMDSMGKTYKLI